MALIGINPVAREREPSTLEKIAMGVGIAKDVLGTAFIVPQFLQQRKESELSRALLKANIIGGTEEAKPGQTDAFNVPGVGMRVPRAGGLDIKTTLDIARETRDAREGERPIPGLPEQFGPRVIRDAEGTDLTVVDKKVLDEYSKDFSIARPSEKPEFTLNLGGQEVGFITKRPVVDSREAMTVEDRMRAEFLKQSADYIDMSSNILAMRQAASQPQTSANDATLSFKFIQMLMPGQRIKEQDVDTIVVGSESLLGKAVQAFRNAKEGLALTTNQRKEFMEEAERLISAERKAHQLRENFYRDTANIRGINPNSVVSNFDVSAPGSTEAEAF